MEELATQPHNPRMSFQETSRQLLLTAGLVCVALGVMARPVWAQSYYPLHNFTGADGISPEAALVRGTDGNFYGTTLAGGTGDAPWGTVFRMDLSGGIVTLHTFQTEDPEGYLPRA